MTSLSPSPSPHSPSPPVGTSPDGRGSEERGASVRERDDRARPERVRAHDGPPLTPALRYPALWLALGAFVLLATVALGTIAMPRALGALMVNDKLAHACGYAALMALFAQFLCGARARTALLLALVVLGLAIECLQTLTATRQFEPLDLLANLVGALGVWWLLRDREGSCLPRCEAVLERALGERSSAR